MGKKKKMAKQKVNNSKCIPSSEKKNRKNEIQKTAKTGKRKLTKTQKIGKNKRNEKMDSDL